MKTKLIFTRKDGFYTLEVEVKKGETLIQIAKENAENNKGTLKVENLDGDILWTLRCDEEKE